MKSCKPGPKHRSAKKVKNCKGKEVCVRFGSKSKRLSIKKHIPSRKRSFCARFKCNKKSDPGTPGYQSCKAWNCKTAAKCSYRGSQTKHKDTQRAVKIWKQWNPGKSLPKKYRHLMKKTRSPKKRSYKKKSNRNKTSSRNKIYTSASGRKYSSCWSGYVRRGWKTKNGRRVPNCVKA